MFHEETMTGIERRRFLKGAGWLFVFLGGWINLGKFGVAEPLPFAFLGDSLKKNPELDAWLRLAPDEGIVAFTGKAELGQIVADGLALPIGHVRLISAATALTQNEGYTVGSAKRRRVRAFLRLLQTGIAPALYGSSPRLWGTVGT